MVDAVDDGGAPRVIVAGKVARDDITKLPEEVEQVCSVPNQVHGGGSLCRHGMMAADEHALFRAARLGETLPEPLRTNA
jgi:hypothetical protein